MRVGYLTYGLDRAPTGIGRYAAELLKALASLPQAPEIVLLTTERADKLQIWNQFERHALIGCHLLPGLMTVGHLAVSAASARYHLDLVHDPNGIAPFLGPAAGARRVVTIHDAFAYVDPRTHNRLDNWRYRWQLPSAARRADAVITVSNCSKRDLTRHLRLDPDQVHVISEGVDPQFSHEPEPNELHRILARYHIKRPYLLYVGGINGRKNIARLYEAYACVRKRHADLALVIVGKRQWRASDIDLTARRLGLESVVQYTGYMPDADLPAIYGAAEAFVFPSLYEGFGLPPLEAMACGTPVVTSNTSSLPEVVEDAALTVDPCDVGALVKAIERVLSDATLRSELRARGIQRAHHFTWQRAAGETVALYEQILA